MSLPAVTASIVTFRTDFSIVKDVLDSLRACTLPLEIIIVDNTPEKEYFEALQAMSGVRCIHNPENPGYGAGHNLAVRESWPAPYHLVLNPDVFVHTECIERLVTLMEKEPDIGLAVPKIFYLDGALQPLNKRDPTMLDLYLRRFVPDRWQTLGPVRRRIEHYIMMDYGYDRSYEVPYVSGCFMLFRRSVFEAIDGFDERFFMHFEDADISRRVRTVARIRYCPDAQITHRWARGTHKSWLMTLTACKSAFQYFNKWGWRWW
ncbi:MAG: glycosyltransferase family 2 protein [Pseudomonadota bacterium]|nr:glycosyltransferase family 2 protein [Pseudomonadota bacterium]